MPTLAKTPVSAASNATVHHSARMSVCLPLTCPLDAAFAEIRDTLNNLILKVRGRRSRRFCCFRLTARLSRAQSPQSWQTTAGLPFFQITGTASLTQTRLT